VTRVPSPTTALLHVLVAKPISIFVWWLAEGANRCVFDDRARLARLARAAQQEGRPVVFASNHVSMFDDPVLPMTLFRTGPRAAAELATLLFLIALWGFGPAPLARSTWLGGLALCVGIAFALFGAHKIWWSLGDLVNFSGASALRGKLETGRARPLTAPLRAALALADPAIFHFMRSGAVKTVMVDRRPGADARDARARSVAATIEIAARGEPVWVFFEGGRSRDPERIAPARAGIGSIALELERRGLHPAVFAIHHRGLEQIIPISSRRWITSGHTIEVHWCEVKLETCSAPPEPDDAQRVADQIREAVVGLQHTWRAGAEATG